MQAGPPRCTAEAETRIESCPELALAPKALFSVAAPAVLRTADPTIRGPYKFSKTSNWRFPPPNPNSKPRRPELLLLCGDAARIWVWTGAKCDMSDSAKLGQHPGSIPRPDALPCMQVAARLSISPIKSQKDPPASVNTSAPRHTVFTVPGTCMIRVLPQHGDLYWCKNCHDAPKPLRLQRKTAERGVCTRHRNNN